MNSYEELKGWVERDLGHITNLKQLSKQTKAFLQKIDNHQPTQDQNFIEEVIHPLQSIITVIDNDSLSDHEKSEWANRLLKNVFINSFFKKEHYTKRIEALMNPTNYEAEVVTRLKSPNPLPTLDAIFILADDPRTSSQTERAATLVAANLEIFTKLKTDQEACYSTTKLTWEQQSPFFGATVITTDHGNIVHSATDSKHITILINGQAYALTVIDQNNQPLNIQEIKNSLDFIINDFNQNKHNSSLGSITAAPRRLCHKIRAELEKRGDNANSFKLIDESLFILCIDQNNSKTDNSSKEQKFQNLFNNFTNRWYGTSQIIVGPDGEAGFMTSYSRGDNISSIVPLIDTVADLGFSLSICSKAGTLPKTKPKKIEFNMDENELAPLVTAAAPYFHDKRAIFSLDLGVSFFIKRGLHANAAMQLLIMLAARNLDANKKLPIFKQALAVQSPESTGSSLDWTFIPTHKIKKFVTAVEKQQSSDQELFNLFKEAADSHAETIKKTSTGWSPTYCLKKPDGILYDKLAEFFVGIGNQLEGGYAGYLFRPIRLPGSMDILTSLHKLPKNIISSGRPGGTLEAASKFGAHISFGRNKFEFSWMPNASAGLNMIELDAALRKWIDYIDKLSAAADA